MSSDNDNLNDYDLNKLHSDLVFTRFGELAQKRNTLYSDYIEIDEPDEIGNAWVNFSTAVVNDLLSVIDLTKSLFDRLIDELRRSKEDPDKEELNRVRNLTDFWLDLSVMSYLYATIEKRGVLNQAGIGKNSLGYINTKQSIDDLTLLAFQAGQEFFSLDARITLGEVLTLDQEKKRLDYLEHIEKVDEMRNHLLGDYDKKQAMFLMSRVKNRLVSSSSSWWWKDPIGMHSASEHAISHIKSAKKYWSQSTSDLQENISNFYDQSYPVAKISSDVSLAQHFRSLGMAALESRATSVAAEYFTKAAELTKSLGLEYLGFIDNLEIWQPSIQEQFLIFNQMKHLSTIASKYRSILKYLKKEKYEEILILIPEIQEKISKMLTEGDIAYVSSVAVAYETVFEYISEQIKNNTEPSKIIKFVEGRINTVGERLHKASHQITVNWLEVVKKDASNIVALNEVISKIDYPLMAIYILPPDLDIVKTSSHELLAIKLATEALTIAAKAEEEFGKNPVKEMLMRAKTFELTQQAKLYIGKVPDEDTSDAVKKILSPISRNAFLRGLIAEIQLRTAVLQFRFINRIAPLVENSTLAKPNQQEKIKNDEEELNSFKQSLNELNIAASEIRKHKAPITIGGAPLNWQYILKIEYYSSGLIKIIDSVKYAINAAVSAKQSIDDAISNWDDAKTLAFDAADIIIKAGSKDAENLSQQVYSLAQLYYSFENKNRERKETEVFPVDGVVELLQALVMGM